MSASEPVYLMAAVDAAATELGRRLRATGGKVVTVESCTGGLIAKALTEAAGSSHWFDRGLVTYSNESKVQLAGVLPATLAEHGAVSEEVAREMADGGLALGAAPSASPGAPAGGDAAPAPAGDAAAPAPGGVVLALSVTGIAGPGGATESKPLGTVCFGWARPGRPTRSATLRFAGDRGAVRLQAALHALREGLRLVAAQDAPDAPPSG